MRLPFGPPPQDEVAAVATDLIVRFGLQAHDEALYLAELSELMRARWNRRLYQEAARAIETSFAEARVRLNRDRTSNRPGLPHANGERIAGLAGRLKSMSGRLRTDRNGEGGLDPSGRN